ncbi:MAG TPA: heavy metal-binding domain-containing protein [Acidimicrobiales bacterium]|nr:heavy metal-binding domain-containing protein [Acidimicrobiales bacterium]
MTVSDVPPESAGRLESGTFSSGLTIPDFAACLHMGMRPVALVQGYCVMSWGWFGTGGLYARYQGSGLSTYRCPHGYYAMGPDHRTWGQNTEQTWATQAWATGFNTAYHRMVEEAAEAGAHGVIGVVDTSRHLLEGGIREFHMYGTAVVVEGRQPPAQIWTCYLAGERLAKLMEAGFFPVSVSASMASVLVQAVCATEMLLHGSWDTYGMVNTTDEITQVADAEMQACRMARDRVRSTLGGDRLHGASIEAGWKEVGAGLMQRDCVLRGSRVRHVSDPGPIEPPRPVVVLRG